MNIRWFVLTAAACAVVVPAVIVAAADQDLTVWPRSPGRHRQLWPPGASATRCSRTFLAHILDPNEVTIFKGGTVTFTVHGMGHGIAIYPVSKNTTRVDIAEDLCQGPAGPAAAIRAACNVAK